MLSFLAWFKNKAKGAQQIFLQDPYFEDVAMYFLASAEISCEYTVLTQTKLKTNPDGRNNFINEGESGQRKLKLLNCIKAYPLMFDSMKLNIYDISNKHNVSHDRYLIFFMIMEMNKLMPCQILFKELQINSRFWLPRLGIRP